MINAQEWLNQKFPTTESKERVKKLNISSTNNSAIWVEFHANESLENEMFLKCPPEVVGNLDFAGFVNLESLGIDNLKKIKSLKLKECAKLINLGLLGLSNLEQLDLGKNVNLVNLKTNMSGLAVKITTYLEAWKAEIEGLKEQLAEYESDTASQASSESSYSDLEAKIREKEAQLNNVRDGSRRSTAPLRKEIELLKKLLQAENKVKELERKEQDYKNQRQLYTFLHFSKSNKLSNLLF